MNEPPHEPTHQKEKSLVMNTCPSRNDLSAFHVGKLPAPALDTIAEHLGACPTCAHALDTLDDGSDLLLSDLRKPAPKTFDDAEARRAATLVEKIGVELSAPGAASTH